MANLRSEPIPIISSERKAFNPDDMPNNLTRCHFDFMQELQKNYPIKIRDYFVIEEDFVPVVDLQPGYKIKFNSSRILRRLVHNNICVYYIGATVNETSCFVCWGDITWYRNAHKYKSDCPVSDALERLINCDSETFTELLNKEYIVSELVPIPVPVFEDGRPKRCPKLDENGNLVLDSYGTPVIETKTTLKYKPLLQYLTP